MHITLQSIYRLAALPIEELIKVLQSVNIQSVIAKCKEIGDDEKIETVSTEAIWIECSQRLGDNFEITQ